MTEHFDQAVWNGLVARLADVEPLIPPAPAWRTAHDPIGVIGPVRLRTVVRPARPAQGRHNPRTAVLLFVAVAVALALIAGALLAGVGRQPAPRPSVIPPSPAGRPPLVQTGSMAWGREGHSATLLANGQVLIIEGTTTLLPAELFDPKKGTFRQAAQLATGTEPGGAAILSDGRVLVTGNRNPVSQLYDPVAGTFKVSGSSKTQGWAHLATTLFDGRVLLAGSPTSDPYSDTTTAELFDPATVQFRLTGSMTHPQPTATATLLGDGRVLMIGTDGGDWTAELFSLPGQFTATGALHAARVYQAAVRLQDGRVLVVGGMDPTTFLALDSAEIYDPASGQFQLTGAMAEALVEPSATLLSDGRVLISGGGWADGNALSRSTRPELYDPATGQFSVVPTSIVLPYESSATLLPDGDVLIAGGWSDNFGPLLNTAYLFDYRAVPTP